MIILIAMLIFIVLPTEVELAMLNAKAPYRLVGLPTGKKRNDCPRDYG